MFALLQLEPNRKPCEVVAKTSIGCGLKVADSRRDVGFAILDKSHVPGGHHAVGRDASENWAIAFADYRRGIFKLFAIHAEATRLRKQ